jgi:hypothetical protein
LDELGARGHSVRLNGKVFEPIATARDHRRRRDLYHAALIVQLDGERYTIESVELPDRLGPGAHRRASASAADRTQVQPPTRPSRSSSRVRTDDVPSGSSTAQHGVSWMTS